MRGGLGGRLGSGSVRSTTAAAVREQNQVEPTILFACPAQIPRSSLRSFSLWARHSAETSAELNVRSVRRNFSPWPAGRCEGEEAAEGRKCEGGAGNGSGSRVVHDTNLRSVG